MSIVEDQRLRGRSSSMEGRAALDLRALGGELDLRIIVVAADQLVGRRMAAALAAEALVPFACATDIEEVAAAPGGTHIVVALASDVTYGPGMAVLRRARKLMRHARIIVVSPVANGPAVRRALEAGADGVVLDPELERTLGASVRAVATGQAVVPRDLRACVQKAALSHRERQVLRLVATGLMNREIGERLFLSESTVKSHLSSAFMKLGVRSRKEAAALVLDPELRVAEGIFEEGDLPPLAGGAWPAER